jgi:hypothetical protein
MRYLDLPAVKATNNYIYKEVMLNILTERQATAKLSTKTPKASVQT